MTANEQNKKNERIDTHQKKDALTAQLALAAEEKDQQEAPDSKACLTNEQLASIAMGTSSPEEKKQAMAHFAECKKCYNALVAISFSIASVERSGGTSRSASTVRNLTWLGSAFAIAASVVVFLNIREVPREINQQDFVTSAPVIEQSAVERAPVPKVSSDTIQPQTKSLQKRAMPEAMSLDEERERASAQEALETRDLEQWMSDIASACISKSTDRGKWLRLRAQGTSVVASVADAERGVELEKIVKLLPESGETPSPQQCSRIFSLLAEQSQWE